MDCIGNKLNDPVSLELQNLFHAFALSEQNLRRILADMGYVDVSSLEHALQHAVQLRQNQEASQLYLLQQTQVTSAMSYAVAPLLCSVLGYPTHYLAQAQTWLLDFYQHYFRIDALASAKQQALQQMQLCLDLAHSDLNAQEFYIASFLQALLDPQTNIVVSLGEIALIAELKQQLMAYYGIQILEFTAPCTDVVLTDSDYKKLFWKRKEAHLAEVSQKIAQENSRLVAKLCNLSRTDAERFIEDLMYGEHVFEKVSVLGEFSDTIYKHQQEKLLKLSA